ncbi:MAG: hypothetical protein R3Y63_10185 [Eubacteriales bacterium]
MNERFYETAQEGMLQKEIGRMILRYTKAINLDVNNLLADQSHNIVEEITSIFQSAPAYPDDQKLVEQIMSVLHAHGISTGVCHDY